MINCSTCGKENEDFFKFCLGCGSELGSTSPAEESAPEQEPPAQWPLHNTSPETDAEAVVEGARASAQSEVGGASEQAYGVVGIDAPEDAVDPAPPAMAADHLDLVRPDEHVLMGGLPDPDKIITVIRPALDGEETERQCRVCTSGIPMDYTFCAVCGAPAVIERTPSDTTAEERDLAPSGEPRGRLVLVREDGADRASYELDRTTTILGRDNGQIRFDSDEFLAAQHVSFTYRGDRLVVRPLDTTNGVFLRLNGEVEIVSGDSLRIGQELLTFQSAQELANACRGEDDVGTQWLGSALSHKVWGRLSQRIGPGLAANAYLLEKDDVFIGRESGQITFPNDGYVSGCHAVIARRSGRTYVKDLDSSNGTYLRLRDEVELVQGDHLLIGQQLLRVEP